MYGRKGNETLKAFNLSDRLGVVVFVLFISLLRSLHRTKRMKKYIWNETETIATNAVWTAYNIEQVLSIGMLNIDSFGRNPNAHTAHMHATNLWLAILWIYCILLLYARFWCRLLSRFYTNLANLAHACRHIEHSLSLSLSFDGHGSCCCWWSSFVWWFSMR